MWLLQFFKYRSLLEKQRLSIFSGAILEKKTCNLMMSVVYFIIAFYFDLMVVPVQLLPGMCHMRMVFLHILYKCINYIIFILFLS